MSAALKKITTAAKKIRKAHPQMKWASAIKQAGAKYRAGKLGGKARKKSAPKKRKAAPRKSASRKRSIGAVPGPAVVSKSAIASHYKVQLGNQLLQRELAKTKTKKRQISKKISLTRKALNFF